MHEAEAEAEAETAIREETRYYRGRPTLEDLARDQFTANLHANVGTGAYAKAEAASTDDD